MLWDSLSCLIFIRHKYYHCLSFQMAMPAVDCLADLKIVSRKYIQNAKAYLLYNSDIFIFHFPRCSPPHPRHPTCQSFLRPKKDFLLGLYTSLFSQSDMSTIVCKSIYH